MPALLDEILVRANILVASAWCFFLTVAAGAQAPPVTRTAQKTDALRNAEAAVSKAAGERKIRLTDEAKKTLALEIVRQEAASTKPVTAEPSPAAVDRVLAPVAEQAKSTAVSAADARAAVVNDKARQVAVTIDKDVAAQFARTNKTLTEGARARLLSDLQEQTDALSRSGLDVPTIRSRNQAFLSAIDSLIAEGTITETTYQQARAAIFQRLVKLTLDTVPAGATVTMGGGQIGVTPIVDKRFESRKSYRFEFQLSGYLPTTREFYVAPEPEAQRVAEPLVLDSGPASDRSQNPDRQPPRGGWDRTALTAMIVGGLVLLVIVVLIARRKRA